MKTPTVRLVTVPNCANCPFSYSPDDDGDWTCTATEETEGPHEGCYREIKRLQTKRGGPWLPPPKWCPLRTEVIAVSLESKP